jgi:signal peptidase II
MLYLILILILLVFDQISKYLFGFVFNTGSAFGLFKEYAIILTIFSFLMLIVFSYLFFKHKKYRLIISLVLAGIMGNLIDRLIFGYVRDFIDLRVWPVFNLADAYLVVALLLFIYFEYFKKS